MLLSSHLIWSGGGPHSVPLHRFSVRNCVWLLSKRSLHHVPVPLGRVGVGPRLLQGLPVADGQRLGPVFILGLVAVLLHLVGVGVGGFLHVGVVPLGLVHVVGPHQHILGEVVLVRVPVQGAVDQGHGLGAGDVAVGLERPVLIAVDEALVGGLVDVVRGR